MHICPPRHPPNRKLPGLATASQSSSCIAQTALGPVWASQMERGWGEGHQLKAPETTFTRGTFVDLITGHEGALNFWEFSLVNL